MISWLLHSANRNIKSENDEVIQAFYAIKDRILKKYGKVIGYDVQKIKGTRCNVCDGHGNYPKYGYNGKVYDYADCYHCLGGWYKLPKWIALHRIKFGPYIFHKPLKRHECVQNPFTEEELGWKVTDQPIIIGYIDHDDHWFGDYAILMLLFVYNRAIFNQVAPRKWYWKKVRIKNWFNNKFRWSGWIVEKPRIHIRQYMDEQLTVEDELPF